MVDKDDEDMDFGEELFGGAEICETCGEWGCTLHKKGEMAGMVYFDIVEFIRAIAPEAARIHDEGDGIQINTGEATTFEEMEEQEEQEEWLPDPKKPRVTVSGGVMNKKEMGDDEKPGTPDDTGMTHVEVIGNDVIASSDGSMHSFRQYRAKKEAERAEWIREKAMALVPRLERQLRNAFEAEARKSRERNQKRGQIDKGRLSSLVSDGKADIFAKKANKIDIHSAITIVLDDSFSMQDAPNVRSITGQGRRMKKEEWLATKAGCAAILAYALGEVCKRLNVPLEILSYQAEMYAPEGGAYLGFLNHYSIQYKTFTEPWDQVKDRLGMYLPSAGKDVPYEAALFADKRLLARPEERKILFFLTDGNDCNKGVSKLGDLARELHRKHDVRMVGVGILSDALKRHMKEKAETVLKLEELSDAVFSRLAKIIHPI